MVKVKDLVLSGAQKLEGVTESPRVESRILLAHALSVDVSHIIIHGETEVPAEKYELFDNLISMRLKHKPIAYITGKKEFFGLDFYVNEHTLIPRPETEMIVEEIISSGKKTLLDLCTGSGCIPVAAAKNSGITAVGVDISSGAVEIATKNAKAHYLEDKVTFKVADVLKKDLFGRFDIITSNPPYITEQDMLSISPDVKNFEPHIALAGGKDGLSFYRRITEIAPKNLEPDGLLIFEIGIGQGESVAQLMEKNFTDIKIKKDLAGIDRVVLGRVK